MRPENKFCVLSINSKKSSIEIRNKIVLAHADIKSLYLAYPNIANLIILSTCNRFEIYTPKQFLKTAKDMLFSNSLLSTQEFEEHLVVMEGESAIKHLWRVCSGLESQILGDYEVMGQVKTSFFVAKEARKLTGDFEKIFNFAFETSKEIKNNTQLSDGTTSVSFYAIQFLRNFLKTDASKKYNLVLLGLGKIGLNTLKNLKHYLPDLTITIINRNNEKAALIAKKFDVQMVSFEHQNTYIKKMDILIVATGASHHIVFKSDIEHSAIKYIFDLSVPSNIDPEINQLPQVRVVNIDQLSTLTTETLKNRETQIPIAEAIIETQYLKLVEWYERRKKYVGHEL